MIYIIKVIFGALAIGGGWAVTHFLGKGIMKLTGDDDDSFVLPLMVGSVVVLLSIAFMFGAYVLGDEIVSHLK